MPDLNKIAAVFRKRAEAERHSDEAADNFTHYSPCEMCGEKYRTGHWHPACLLAAASACEAAATLDKTMDGKIIHPKIDLWHPDQVTKGPLRPFVYDDEWEVDVPTHIGRDNFVDQSFITEAESCYSNHAAALAAKEKPCQ